MDEVEIKFRLDGPAEHERLRAALRALDAERRPPDHEVNRLFDDERGTLKLTGGGNIFLAGVQYALGDLQADDAPSAKGTTTRAAK